MWDPRINTCVGLLMFPLRAVADDHHITIAREQARLVAANDEVLHELAVRLAGLRANPLVLEAQLPEHPPRYTEQPRRRGTRLVRTQQGWGCYASSPILTWCQRNCCSTVVADRLVVDFYAFIVPASRPRFRLLPLRFLKAGLICLRFSSGQRASIMSKMAKLVMPSLARSARTITSMMKSCFS